MGILAQAPQEYEQQQGQPMPSMLVQPPMPDPPEADFFRFRITSEDIIELVEHKLRGEEYDETAKKYVQKYTAWCNDEFINIALSTIQDYANKNTYLGNFSTDQINYKCNKIKKKLAKLLFRNYNRYGIAKEKRSLIIDKIMNCIHSSLSRSDGGKEAIQLSTATQRHEVYHEEKEPAQRQPGILSGVLGRFSRGRR